MFSNITGGLECWRSGTGGAVRQRENDERIERICFDAEAHTGIVQQSICNVRRASRGCTKAGEISMVESMVPEQLPHLQLNFSKQENTRT